MTVAWQKLTNNFCVFIQNTSTDLCKTIKSELLMGDAFCTSEKSRYESLLGDFITIRLSVSEPIDLSKFQMNAQSFSEVHTYLRCNADSLNSQEDIYLYLKTVNQIIENRKKSWI